MKKSSFIIVSLFTLVLGAAILVPNSSMHDAVSTAPQVAAAIPASDSVAAAPAPVPAVSAAPQPAPKAPLAEASQGAPASAPAASGPLTTPTTLSIPAIGLHSEVIPVSTNGKGEMSVPSGSTSDIGWYADGVVPGSVGTAVMDAHVFAGFSNLHKLQKGDDLYVVDANGNRLHFVVIATQLYALADLTPDMLFQNTDGRHLNLITCAGSLTPDHSTYDHRLIVYTELAQ